MSGALSAKVASLSASAAAVMATDRKKFALMRKDNTRERYSRKRFCYGLADAGDACEAAAYLGSITCFRIAAYNFFIAVRLA